MTLYEKLKVEMVERVDEYGASNAPAFPTESRGGKSFAIIHERLVHIREQGALQASGHHAAVEGTSSKSDAIDELRDQMEAISRTARAIALDDPGFDDKFPMPSGRGGQDALSSARAFLTDARPFEKAFVDHFLPGTFLADLQQAIDAVDAAGRGQDSGKETHVAARASIGATLDEIFVEIKRLDAIVRNRFRDEPDKVAAWRSARHVERLPHWKAEQAKAQLPAAEKAVSGA